MDLYYNVKNVYKSQLLQSFLEFMNPSDLKSSMLINHFKAFNIQASLKSDNLKVFKSHACMQSFTLPTKEFSLLFPPFDPLEP